MSALPWRTRVEGNRWVILVLVAYFVATAFLVTEVKRLSVENAVIRERCECAILCEPGRP